MPTALAKKLPLVALLSANVLSLTGNRTHLCAIPWFVLQTTGSVAKTGIVAFFATVPALLASFLSGPLVDRWGHRRTSIVADVASGSTIALIPLLHGIGGIAFWQILALTFLGARLDVPGELARDSLVPDLATRAGIGSNVSMLRTNFSGRTSGLLGPPLAGVLVAFAGPSMALTLDAATFAISAALIAWCVPVQERTTIAAAPFRLRASLARSGKDCASSGRIGHCSQYPELHLAQCVGRAVVSAHLAGHCPT